MGTLTDPVTGSGSCPACSARVSNSTGYLRLLQSQRVREPAERLAQRARPWPALPVHREGAQHRSGAIGLGVDASDDRRAVDQGEDIVAPDTLVGPLVD